VTQSALSVSPAYRTTPEYSRTLGPEVGDLGSMVRFAPYPEQQLLLDDTFAIDKNGRSVAFEVAAIACRQELKTGFLKLAALGWLFVTDQELVVWSAHEFRTSQEAFRDLSAIIEGSDMLTRRVKKIYSGTGDESVELMSGARLIFKARTSGGGRGLTGHKVILDEAFALQPEHMDALLPTLLAVPDPQVVYGSSAGLAKSGILRALRDRGRAGGDRLIYNEWCSPRRECLSVGCDHQVGTDGCALDDEDGWRVANPVKARNDPAMTVLRALRAALTPEGFARECLGWWDEAAGEMVVPAAAWAGCLDIDSKIMSAPIFALDVSPSRSWAAVAVAGMNTAGVPHIEITSSKGVVDHRPGVDWAVPCLVDLASVWPGMKVAIASGSAAESLVPALLAAGVDLLFVKSGDVSAACGMFYDLATTKGLRHVGQPELTDALSSARKNVEDGEGAWKWGRRKSSGDISTLYAVTLALWVATQNPDYDIADSFG
jgi:hypothetical protein